MKFLNLKAFVIFSGAYANDNDALIPELWAQETIQILRENMVAAALVHRDFEPTLANFGDTVNTRKPNEFEAQNKTDADDITLQDAVSVNVPVKLDQHIHTSFIIKDGESSKSFLDLVRLYLNPAALSIARRIDQLVLAQHAQFLGNTAGQLGAGASKESLLAIRRVMNANKVPMDTRYQALTTQAESEYLAIDNFVTADKIGDDGTALREAILAKKFGIWLLLSQNMSEVDVGNTIVVTTLINNAAGYAKGTTVMTVDGGTAAADSPAGAYITIAGDDTPQRIASIVGDPVTSITVEDGLRFPVLNNAIVTIYAPGEINLAAGFPLAHAKAITVDGFTVAPQVGQIVSFGTAAAKYVIVSVTGLVTIQLERPLEAAVIDDENVNIGPAGNFNFTFHRNCVSLVVRPLAAPQAGAGALSAVVNDEPNQIGIRTTIAYDPIKQGHIVTLDLLAGIKKLDDPLAGVMFS